MSAPPLPALFAALEATWPPAGVIDAAPFRLRKGKGGGQRVSSAIATGVAQDSDIETAEASMRRMDQTPLFMIRPGDEMLDALLADRGYTISDPTLLYWIESGQIGIPAPSGKILPSWPPFAIQREIWAAGGFDDTRLAVMNRAPQPKISLLCRDKDTPAGTVFAAISEGIAMLHALEVSPTGRRKGLGETAVRVVAGWAAREGADVLALAVTEANETANALYMKLGMRNVGRYHYRRAPEAAA